MLKDIDYCQILIFSCVHYNTGGPSIQRECTASVKRYGKLLVGQVYVSGAGKLSFKKVCFLFVISFAILCN